MIMKPRDKTALITIFLTAAWITGKASTLIAIAHSSDSTIQVPVATIVDKIRGGLLGQMLGNLNGLPHEFEYYEEPGNVRNYIPALPDGARTDDDTDVEWLYIYEMERLRDPFLPPEKIVSIWKDKINDRIWNANRYTRYLMDIGVEPPYTGYTLLNPWGVFNISGMFSSETFALAAPAMPQTAARIGLHYTTVTISAEPAQATQLFTTMISTAFTENDINKILDAGIAALDPQSILLQVISDVKKWYGQHPDDWREMRRLLLEKYITEGGSTRNTRDNNGHELHTAFAVAALLYGQGDFAETLKLTFNFGLDADNTAAMAGTILGVIYGYRKMLAEEDWQIVDRYSNTTRDNMPMNETITSFADRVINVFEMVNQQNGGRKSVAGHTLVYEIPREKPAIVTKLLSSEAQKQQLRDHFEEEIRQGLSQGDRMDRARAAYLAVCLDLYESMSKSYPRQWKEAAFDLSGYWKVMNNIFYGGDFLDPVRDRFLAAGFKKPAKRFSDNELWNGSEIWKDPKELY